MDEKKYTEAHVEIVLRALQDLKGSSLMTEAEFLERLKPVILDLRGLGIPTRLISDVIRQKVPASLKINARTIRAFIEEASGGREE